MPARRTHNVTDRSGPVVGLKVVEPEEDLMIITTSGIIIRTEMKGISVMGRYTQGVKLIRLSENEQVGSVAKCPPTEDEDMSDEDVEERMEDLQDGETVEATEPTEPTEPTEE